MPIHKYVKLLYAAYEIVNLNSDEILDYGKLAELMKKLIIYVKLVSRRLDLITREHFQSVSSGL